MPSVPPPRSNCRANSSLPQQSVKSRRPHKINLGEERQIRATPVQARRLPEENRGRAEGQERPQEGCGAAAAQQGLAEPGQGAGSGDAWPGVGLLFFLLIGNFSGSSWTAESSPSRNKQGEPLSAGNIRKDKGRLRGRSEADSGDASCLQSLLRIAACKAAQPTGRQSL